MSLPKRLHQVWVGTNPMPEVFRTWAETWRREHPDWDFTLWAEHPDALKLGADIGPWKTVAELPPLLNAHLRPMLPELVTRRATPAAVSDMWRYEVVARYGGIYIDGDVECFQSIDELVEGVDLCCADEYGPAPGNFLFGATPNHPAMWTVVRELEYAFRQAKTRDEQSRRNGDREGRLPVNPVVLCGPCYLNRQLQKYRETVFYPWGLFNPLSAWDDYRLVRRWPESAYANHHFYGTWYDREKKVPSREFLDG